tara:strand:+ start:666 stop:875 length:210 start_codon:yes stop_codon:yes gene_type:complete
MKTKTQEIKNVLWLIDTRINKIKKEYNSYNLSSGSPIKNALKEWEHIKNNLLKDYDIKKDYSFKNLNLK